MRAARVFLVTFFVVAFTLFFAFAMVFAATACSSSAQSAKVQQAEADFCKLRAEYKLIAAAAGGALNPAPGSPRDKLEQAEDNVCALRALASDGGP